MELEIGKYYSCDYHSYNYIFIYNGTVRDVVHFSKDRRGYYKQGWNFYENPKASNLRLATQDEINHLDLCIKENQYVDYFYNTTNTYELW